jgi:hypothetical protein
VADRRQHEVLLLGGLAAEVGTTGHVTVLHPVHAVPGPVVLSTTFAPSLRRYDGRDTPGQSVPN